MLLCSNLKDIGRNDVFMIYYNELLFMDSGNNGKRPIQKRHVKKWYKGHKSSHQKGNKNWYKGHKSSNQKGNSKEEKGSSSEDKESAYTCPSEFEEDTSMYNLELLINFD